MVFTKKKFLGSCPDCDYFLEAASESSLASNLRRHRNSCGAANIGLFYPMLLNIINRYYFVQYTLVKYFPFKLKF